MFRPDGNAALTVAKKDAGFAMHRIARSTGSMQAGSRSLSSALDFGVHVALGQAGGRFADPNASHEERQMALCPTRLALRLQDCAC
jgi:hypothetical protein